MEDCNSPYFMQYSDQPDVAIVLDLLVGTNYSSWSKAILMALTVKNRVSFINGSIVAPSEVDSP